MFCSMVYYFFCYITMFLVIKMVVLKIIRTLLSTLFILDELLPWLHSLLCSDGSSGVSSPNTFALECILLECH